MGLGIGPICTCIADAPGPMSDRVFPRSTPQPASHARCAGSFPSVPHRCGGGADERSQLARRDHGRAAPITNMRGRTRPAPRLPGRNLRPGRTHAILTGNESPRPSTLGRTAPTAASGLRAATPLGLQHFPPHRSHRRRSCTSRGPAGELPRCAGFSAAFDWPPAGVP